MRTAFIEALTEAARQDERLWLLTGDLGYSVLEPFAQEFSERFVNVGVAEQSMMGVAAGLALSGKTVFTYSIANFGTLRCLEQIRNDICHHGLNVKIVAVGAGVAYGTHGYSHFAVEDLAILRSLHPMTIVAPADPVEARLATLQLCQQTGPAYLRIGKAGEPILHPAEPTFEIGRAIHVLSGNDLTLISTGSMLQIALDTAKKLAQQGVQARVLSLHTIQPIDQEALIAAATETTLIATLEEHVARGGLQAAILETLAEKNLQIPCLRFGLRDEVLRQSGGRDFLLQQSGLTADLIATRILKSLHSLHPKFWSVSSPPEIRLPQT